SAAVGKPRSGRGAEVAAELPVPEATARSALAAPVEAGADTTRVASEGDTDGPSAEGPDFCAPAPGRADFGSAAPGSVAFGRAGAEVASEDAVRESGRDRAPMVDRLSAADVCGVPVVPEPVEPEPTVFEPRTAAAVVPDAVSPPSDRAEVPGVAVA